jgi:hypothetical protein
VATLWYGPKSGCPPTEIAPLDVPASGEAAGRESEPPFTTEVAALLNVPLNIIYKWHKEGTGPPGIKRTRRANPEEAMWSGGWRARGHTGGLSERMR